MLYEVITKGVEYEHFIQPEANRNIANGKADDFDLLVFYDMWQQISDSEKQAYLNLTLKGKPMLFLHHSIVSYQNWPQFEQIVGGRYVLEAPGVDVITSYSIHYTKLYEAVAPSRTPPRTRPRWPSRCPGPRLPRRA